MPYRSIGITVGVTRRLLLSSRVSSLVIKLLTYISLLNTVILIQIGFPMIDLKSTATAFRAS